MSRSSNLRRKASDNIDDFSPHARAPKLVQEALTRVRVDPTKSQIAQLLLTKPHVVSPVLTKPHMTKPLGLGPPPPIPSNLLKQSIVGRPLASHKRKQPIEKSAIVAVNVPLAVVPPERRPTRAPKPIDMLVVTMPKRRRIGDTKDENDNQTAQRSAAASPATSKTTLAAEYQVSIW